MEIQEKVWDNIAKNWNKFREVPSPTVNNFLKNKTGNILDLGCGSGRNFSAIKKDVKLYGIDFSSEMLKFAEKKAEELKLNYEMIHANSKKIPFKDNYFDSVICVAVLHCVDSPIKRQETIDEIFRVLKKDGEALISVWGRKSPRLKNKPKECFIPWSVDNDKEHRKGEKVIKQNRYTYIYDLEELKNEVKKAGFEIVKIWEERNINVICKKS